MNRPLKALALTGALAAGSLAASPDAAAAQLAALTGDRSLVVITTVGPNAPRVLRRLEVGTAAPLAGIDSRAADGLLYGVTTDGQIVTIDRRTGAATASGTLTLPLPGVQLSVDINPVADAIRIVGTDGSNLRHAFATGTTFADTSLNSPSPPAPPNPFGDAAPDVVGVAYTNTIPGANVPGTTATQLIDIDANPQALYLQVPANSGTLNAIGRVTGGTLGSPLGFDIFVNSNGRNTGLIVTGNRLLTIDVIGGEILGSARVRGLNAPVRDVAALL